MLEYQEFLPEGRFRFPPHAGRAQRVTVGGNWAKTVAGLRETHHRGLPKIDCRFTFAMAADSFIDLRRLLGPTA